MVKLIRKGWAYRELASRVASDGVVEVLSGSGDPFECCIVGDECACSTGKCDLSLRGGVESIESEWER